MSTFIFDFDGTLADSVEVLLEITNSLADEFDFEPLKPAEFERLRELSSRAILQEGRISIWKLPRLVRRLKREQNRQIGRIQLVAGMAEVLGELRRRGDRLGIATSNSAQNLEYLLERHGVSELFEFKESSITLFGKSRRLRRIIRQYHLEPADTIYIGDEVRDMQAAAEVGLHSLGVGWGFNTSAALEAAGAEFVIERPEEILRLSLGSYQVLPGVQPVSRMSESLMMDWFYPAPSLS